MRNQDPSKRVVSLRVCWACVGFGYEPTELEHSWKCYHPPTFTQQTHPLRTRFDDSLLKSTLGLQNSLLDRAYTSISELRVRCAAVSQAVRVGENSAGLAFLCRLENPMGHPPTLWQAHSNPPFEPIPLLPTWLLTYASESSHGRMLVPYTQAQLKSTWNKSYDISEFSFPGVPSWFFPLRER
jgi:hypothetical protein